MSSLSTRMKLFESTFDMNATKLYTQDFQIPFIMVNDKFLIGVKALSDDVSAYDIARTMTYLRKLKMKFGLFLNFGKEELQIRGVYNKK